MKTLFFVISILALASLTLAACPAGYVADSLPCDMTGTMCPNAGFTCFNGAMGDCCKAAGGGGLTPCADKSTSCATWKANGFCTNSFYTCTDRLNSCALTCNVASCSPQATCPNVGVPCVDSDSRCATWVPNGFCKSSFYSCSNRKTSCAKSCGLCSTTC
uniref:ShKT domain-containing protein n=1 Tax=Acrobeloides nanus TaxID=290746 RepID=A0A914EJU7_9BILA